MKTTRSILFLTIISLLPAAAARAQSAVAPVTNTVALLDEIALLEHEVARLKRYHQAPAQTGSTIIAVSRTSTLIVPPPPRRATTLAEAAEEAARIPHAWPRSANSVPPARVVKAVPPVDTPRETLIRASASVLAAPAVVALAAPEPQSETERIDEYRRSAKKDEAQWKNRRQELQTALDSDLIRLAGMLSRVDQLSADFNRTDGVAQRVVLRRELESAQTEATRLRAEVASDTNAIDVLEEEARRAGVPPGWLRP